MRTYLVYKRPQVFCPSTAPVEQRSSSSPSLSHVMFQFMVDSRSSAKLIRVVTEVVWQNLTWILIFDLLACAKCFTGCQSFKVSGACAPLVSLDVCVTLFLFLCSWFIPQILCAITPDNYCRRNTAPFIFFYLAQCESGHESWTLLPTCRLYC